MKDEPTVSPIRSDVRTLLGFVVVALAVFFAASVYVHLLRPIPAPPCELNDSPADRANPLAVCKGIRPDGWVSERATCRLSRPPGASFLIVQGRVPGTDPDFRTDLRLLIDGSEAARQTLGPGDFLVSAPASAGAKPAEVELHFSRSQTLPNGDPQPAAARVSYIGFPTRKPPSEIKVPADLLPPEVLFSGGYSDGWLSEVASFALSQPTVPANLVVRGLIPLVEGSQFRAEVCLRVNRQELVRKSLGVGEFELRASPPAGEKVAHVELIASPSQTLPNGDGRHVTVLLRYAGFVPSGTP